MEENNINTNTSQEAKWYCLKTEPGKEYAVAEALTKKMNNSIIGNSIFAVKIIEDVKTDARSSKKDKKTKTVNRFPNHLYLKLIYSKEIWWEVVSTDGAYSFLGPDARPLALRKEEVYTIGLEERPKQDISTFNIGDEIEILEGPFMKKHTVIVGINPEKDTVTVNIMMMGAEHPLDLSLQQVRKI